MQEAVKAKLQDMFKQGVLEPCNREELPMHHQSCGKEIKMVSSDFVPTTKFTSVANERTKNTYYPTWGHFPQLAWNQVLWKN